MKGWSFESFPKRRGSFFQPTPRWQNCNGHIRGACCIGALSLQILTFQREWVIFFVYPAPLSLGKWCWVKKSPRGVPGANR